MVNSARIFCNFMVAMSVLTLSCGDRASERSPNTNTGGSTSTQSLRDFKLSCSDVNLSSSTQSSYDCSLADSRGNLFKESATQVLDIYIMNGSNKLAFEKSPASSLKSFSFLAPKKDVSNIILKILVVNPGDKNQTLYEISSYLSNILDTGGGGGTTTGTSTTGTQPSTASFVSDVKPIMINNCASCHTSYSNYVAVKNNFANIMRRVNAGSMPPSGKLPSSTIQVLTNWESGSFAP